LRLRRGGLPLCCRVLPTPATANPHQRLNPQATPQILFPVSTVLPRRCHSFGLANGPDFGSPFCALPMAVNLDDSGIYNGAFTVGIGIEA
jgi:hypothetical protein